MTDAAKIIEAYKIGFEDGRGEPSTEVGEVVAILRMNEISKRLEAAFRAPLPLETPSSWEIGYRAALKEAMEIVAKEPETTTIKFAAGAAKINFDAGCAETRRRLAGGRVPPEDPTTSTSGPEKGLSDETTAEGADAGRPRQADAVLADAAEP